MGHAGIEMKDHLDELPGRGRNHVIEDAALAAFLARVTESGAFIVQSTDRKDYGTDCQLEAVDPDSATNVRVHVQLKGTETEQNADGSISVTVARINLNYLLMQPHSLYVCHHRPSESLRFRPADQVLRTHEHAGASWTTQRTVTVSFTEELTVDRLRTLAALARSTAALSRDRRAEQIASTTERFPSVLSQQAPEVHVPADPNEAAALLARLYKRGANEAISASFEKFSAVLGDDDAIGGCYMAEINLGMDGLSRRPHRIEAAIPHFEAKLAGGRYQPGSLHYTIGNAHSALGRDEDARTSYLRATDDGAFVSQPFFAAQVLKNLGSTIERLGDGELAATHYREALRLQPNLPEAHSALAHHHLRAGRYRQALDHFDRVAFTDRQGGRISATGAWRANALFNLGDYKAAFREINTLIGYADLYPWIWPTCAKLVAQFGREGADGARAALGFWRLYVDVHPEHPFSRRELLLTSLYLRSEEPQTAPVYAEFRSEFEQHIRHVTDEDAALPWDRLGHWAQEEDDWEEAERCFRRAYEIEGGHYGYCLGTALNFQGRYEEALPLLFEQAEAIQVDALSWHQLASCYIRLGRTDEAIGAYERALELDPEHAASLFELGGTHWNKGDVAGAIVTWRRAIERFPDHELVASVLKILPLLAR